MNTAARRAGWSTRLVLGLLTWIIVLLFFFPVLWMALTGLKHEQDAATNPPRFLFTPTLSEYSAVWTNGLRPYLEHSITITVTSTLIVLVLALPAAFALSIRPVRKWRDVLFFFISTKMLPIVGAIIPLYVIARDLHLIDRQLALIILYTSMNLPIAVWMLRSFLLEVPRQIIEAAQVDGAGLLRQLRSVVLPVISPGMAATALICFIFAWNEFFLAVNLTTTNAGTVPVFLVGFVAPEGQFWAHLSAAATVACLPVLIAGWAAQDKLVRGLSMGAVQ
ncbi:MAG TPA: carbohydrate ABC transporter permease [Actinocrinis sp.]|jgi:sorbitol/mannitol transport system permease protein|uniref:carbohydrate ABC transporter permease n=1 Tax=Actinocrinis sp. TaxID=1920516 RepID=UPI002DDD55DD|nr:carbohydrate ABC transporter permease [Actinocrinis sp.]HEV3173446.1 carbohydrate ABC transporter permease [Actinocrinis sp.]